MRKRPASETQSHNLGEARTTVLTYTNRRGQTRATTVARVVFWARLAIAGGAVALVDLVLRLS